MDVKQYTMMAVGLIVGVLLIAGVVAPVISDTVSTDNAEVVNDFSESLAYHDSSSDYYKSFKYFNKQGNTPVSPDMTWVAEDFTHISFGEDPWGIDLLYAEDSDHNTLFQIEYNTYLGSTALEEMTLIYWDSVLDQYVKFSDLDNFKLELHEWTFTSTYTYNEQSYSVETEASALGYMSPDENGWLLSGSIGADGVNASFVDGAYILIGLAIMRIDSNDTSSVVVSDATYYLYFEFDESLAENDTYSVPFHLVYEGTDYGEYTLVITSLQTLGDGRYTIDVGNGYFDLQEWDLVSSDGLYSVSLSGESWIDSYSTMNISPYVSYTPSEPISPTLVSLITIIPLLLTVGLVVGAIGFLRMKN